MHLKIEEILKMIYNEVTEDEKERFNKHLLKCEECSNKLIELSKLDYYLKHVYMKKVKTIYFPSDSKFDNPLFLFFSKQPEYELSLVAVKGNVTTLKNHIIKTKLNNLFVKIIKNKERDESILIFIGLEESKIFILDKDDNIILKFNIGKGETIEKRLSLKEFSISTLDDKIKVFF